MNVRVSATERARRSAAGEPRAGGAAGARRARALFDGRVLETAVLRGPAVPGERLRGPGGAASSPEATVVVPPGWAGTVDEHGTLVAGAGA